MTAEVEFDEGYAAEQLRRAQHPLRRVIKRFYLDNILREVQGPTVDLGCGAGQLLRRLPAGSIGLEVNPHLVRQLKGEGLDVALYDAAADDFGLQPLQPARYRTLVMAHVLEHFADAAAVLRKLLRSCRRLGIARVVIIVPGAKGYRSDDTHKTFVDRRYVADNRLERSEGYTLAKSRYFPGDTERIGGMFTFHEMVLVFDAEAPR